MQFKQVLVDSLMKKFEDNAVNPKQKQKSQFITFQETFIKPEKRKKRKFKNHTLEDHSRQASISI